MPATPKGRHAEQPQGGQRKARRFQDHGDAVAGGQSHVERRPAAAPTEWGTTTGATLIAATDEQTQLLIDPVVHQRHETVSGEVPIVGVGQAVEGGAKRMAPRQQRSRARVAVVVDELTIATVAAKDEVLQIERCGAAIAAVAGVQRIVEIFQEHGPFLAADP